MTKIRSYAINQRVNVWLAGLLLLANSCLLFGLPLLLTNHVKLLVFSALSLVLLTSNITWALIHEGIHGSLLKNRVANDRLSRVLSIFFGCSFYILRCGHLLHHQINRSKYDRPDVYEPPAQNYLKRSAMYYGQLLGGLYWVELFAPLLSFLPKQLLLTKLESIADEKKLELFVKHNLFEDKRFKAVRFDTVIIMLLLIVSLYLYGQHVYILFMAIALRAFLISTVDNLPHYATGLSDHRFAYNLQAPKWLSRLILNFNYHRTHHHYPSVPWQHLPQVFNETDPQFDYPYFQQWRRQFRGLVDYRECHNE